MFVNSHARTCSLNVMVSTLLGVTVAQALQVLYSEREVSGDVGLPRHWMRDFFLASLCLEVQENQEGLSRLQVQPIDGHLLLLH